MRKLKKTTICTARAIHKQLLIYIHKKKNDLVTIHENFHKNSLIKNFIRKWIQKKNLRYPKKNCIQTTENDFFCTKLMAKLNGTKRL